MTRECEHRVLKTPDTCHDNNEYVCKCGLSFFVKTYEEEMIERDWKRQMLMSMMQEKSGLDEGQRL